MMRFPKLLKADVERAFIYAYYRFVKDCKVSMDIPDENIIPVVAFAHKTGEIYAMDFSSTYHFAEKVKPSTRVRWIRASLEPLKDEIVYNNAFLWAARLMREAGLFLKNK